MNVFDRLFLRDKALMSENDALRVDVARQSKTIEDLCDQVEAYQEINEYLEGRLREESQFMGVLKARLNLEMQYINSEGDSGAWLRGRLELLNDMIAQAEEKKVRMGGAS